MTGILLTGAVLAGGASWRMGQDKARLILNGEPLWQRQARLLRAAGATTIGIVRRPGQPPLELGPDLRLWFDTVADAGPLAGLHAALAASETDWLAVVATDMPGIDAAWFHWLTGFCRPGCGTIVQHPDGCYEPLAAIYPGAALPEVSWRLHHGPHALQSLAAALVACGQLTRRSLPAGEAWRMANWNTPAEVGAPWLTNQTPRPWRPHRR